jgi:outer membrane protein TolC
MAKEMKKIKLLLLLLLIFFLPIYSQQNLSLKEAIEIALKNNPDIKIYNNLLQIAENNYSLGNANFLPSLNLTGSYSQSITNTRQEYYDGRSISRTNAKSNNLSSGISLQWRIFDGLENLNTYKLLRENKLIAEKMLQSTKEFIVGEVIKNYFNVLQLEERLKYLKETIQISEERVRIAKDKYEVGVGSKSEYLQAIADLNSDRNQFLSQQAELKNAKVRLSEILDLPLEDNFLVTDTIQIMNLKYDELKDLALENNYSVLIAKSEVEKSRLNLGIARSDYFPNLDFNVGYNYSKLKAQAGLLSSNQSYGLNYSLNLSLNLFNGLNTNRAIENAQVELQSNQVKLEKIKLQVKNLVKQNFESYNTNLQLISNERENLEIVKENVQIAIERYKLGIITPIELREAQQSLLAAQSRLISNLYQAKVAEVELLKLSGKLIESIQ